MKALAAAAMMLLASALSSHAGAEATIGIEVEAQVENGPLRGTMLRPPQAAGSPAVVIIPGSGPTDRDGDSPLGVKAGYLRMLAEALAADGVASIRVDKRGLFASAGSFADPNAVTFDDYAGDALAWAETAKRETGAGCAWLLGHSEGGLVALVAAARGSPSLCGIVLVSTPGRKLAEVLREQLRANPDNAPVLPDALAAIDALERGENVDVSDFHVALQQLFAPAVQDFLIDSFRLDPPTLVAGVGAPVLIVQGDEDIQVKPVDAQALSQAQPSAELVILPGMNHVLKTVPAGDMAANAAAYADPGLPLASGLAEAIAGFVTRAR